MGFKGCRLWVMGQLDSNVQRPTVDGAEELLVRHEDAAAVLVVRELVVELAHLRCSAAGCI
jgi:hypothetical protein